MLARLALVLTMFALAGCGRPIDRPLRGAAPGTETAATFGVPPTLSPIDSQRFKPLPSPGVAAGPAASPAASPGAIASPSAVVAPPIVRTIIPPANGHVPVGSPITVSAVLVGRGADLLSASLSVNGADAGAQIDKRTARDWNIHASQALGPGAYTAKVLVKDASGGAGGFTWQFLVGEPETPASAE